MALAFLPEGEDPTILRSSLDTSATGGRINCLMISEDGFSQTKAPVKEDFTRVITTPRGKNTISRKFRLTYFYQFGGSSENQFSSNLELVRTALNSSPKLGFTVTGTTAGPGQFIEGHDELQIISMLPEDFSGTVVHVGEGILTVRIIEGLG